MNESKSSRHPNGGAFLVLKDGHKLSPDKARTVVSDLLKKSQIPSPNGGWRKLKITLNDAQGKPVKDYSFDELVNITRIKGYPEPLQTRLDLGDKVFGGTFGTSASIKGFKIKTEWGKYSKELEAPCSSMPAEMELGKDIQFYKEETCHATEDHDLEMCIRNYRAAIFSSISLVEAYLNKYMLYFENKNINSDNILKYNKTTNLDTKFELFLNESINKGIEVVNKTVEWDHFCKLRNLRNSFIHAFEPFLGYNMKDFATHLNYINTGVGGLLRLTRDLQNEHTLGFIELIRYGAIVVFNEKYNEI